VSLLGLSVEGLLDRLASPDPTPGGGSAAALAGATGAALVTMVCSMPKTRTASPGERERLATALSWAREAGARLRRLVDEDAEAYDVVIASYRLPKGTEAEKATRKEVVARALEAATEVPLRVAEACLVVMSAAEEAAANGNPNALSDVRTGATLAWAGILGAAENVRINAQGTPGSPFLEKLEALLAEGRHRAASLGLFS
jgi:methenyltetrahydrofolate cyclohydrolase